MKITPIKLMQLKEYWLAGTPTKDLAAFLGLSERTVRFYVNVLGISKPVGRPPKLTDQQKERIEELFMAAKDCDSIGSRFGLSARAIRRMCSSSVLRWYRKESFRRNRLEQKLQAETLTFL